MGTEEAKTETKTGRGGLYWTGWVLSVLPSLMMLAGVVYAFLKPEESAKGFTDMGYPERAFVPLVFVQFVCVVLYLIPWTSMLGAILLTGYLGGAVATHVHADDGMFFIPVIVGGVFWLGLYLREPRLRALVPIKW